MHLALCFLPCLQARDARHHGRYGPGGLFRHVQGLVCWYLTMSLALCSSCVSQAQDARHHGRHGPQDSYVEVHRCSSWTRLSCPLCATTYALVQLLTVEVPQVQLIIKVIYIPVATQSLILTALTVQQIIEISQELTCPLLGHTGASWCSTGAALGQGPRARCVHDKCPDPDRRAVQKTVEIPQLQFFFKVVIIPVGAPRHVPMVSLFSRPRRFSCCSTLTRCSTIGLCSPAGSSGAVVEKTV